MQDTDVSKDRSDAKQGVIVKGTKVFSDVCLSDQSTRTKILSPRKKIFLIAAFDFVAFLRMNASAVTKRHFLLGQVFVSFSEDFSVYEIFRAFLNEFLSFCPLLGRKW